MGKWLERLSKIKNAPMSHSQNLQKSPFEGFECANSGVIEKKAVYPSIWDVVIQTHGKRCPMIVIDPTHEDEATFKRELVERFGIERLVSVRKRNG